MYEYTCICVCMYVSVCTKRVHHELPDLEVCEACIHEGVRSFRLFIVCLCVFCDVVSNVAQGIGLLPHVAVFCVFLLQLPNGNVSLEGLCFLVPADSKAHSFKPIIVLGPKSIKTLSKVHLEVVNSSEPVKREDVSLVFRVFFAQEISVATLTSCSTHHGLWMAQVFLYGDMFLSHLTAEPAIGNPQLDLYRITREMSQKFIFLQLYNTPPFCLSVLDNLLLVHAPGEKVSFCSLLGRLPPLPSSCCCACGDHWTASFPLRPSHCRIPPYLTLGPAISPSLPQRLLPPLC